MQGVWLFMFIVTGIASSRAARRFIVAFEAVDPKPPLDWTRNYVRPLMHRHPDPGVEQRRTATIVWMIVSAVCFVLFAAS